MRLLNANAPGRCLGENRDCRHGASCGLSRLASSPVTFTILLQFAQGVGDWALESPCRCPPVGHVGDFVLICPADRFGRAAQSSLIGYSITRMAGPTTRRLRWLWHDPAMDVCGHPPVGCAARRHVLLFGAAMANGCRPLNEGRGVNPGDTSTSSPLAGRIHGRSTKAGAWNPGDTPGTGWSGPATCSALNEGRGVNPGDTRGGRLPRGRRWSPLNEGRGVNPGDTSSSLRG